MKHLFYIGLISLLIGCNDVSTPEDPQKEKISQINDVSEQEVKYKILSDEKQGIEKRTVNVLLDERITEQQLEKLAYKIQKMNSETFKRTFIMYEVKGVNMNMAWATTHFNPNLEVKLLEPNITPVNVNNIQDHLEQLGFKPIEIVDSTDSEDNPKKIYIFEKGSSQLEVSESFVLISWTQNDDISLKRVKIIAKTLLGLDAEQFVNEVNRVGQMSNTTINGHEFINSTCISTLCIIKIKK